MCFKIRPGELYKRNDTIFTILLKKGITELTLYEIGKHTCINWLV